MVPPVADEAASQPTFFKRKSSSLLKKLLDEKTTLTTARLSEISSAELSVRIDMLERLLYNFDIVQSSLEQEDHAELDGDARERFDSLYIQVKTLLTQEQTTRGTTSQRLSSTTRQFSVDEPTPTPSFTICQPKQRLPLLTLPKFSGSYTEWPNFFSLFDNVIGKEPDLTKTEKLQHLRLCMEKTALDTISSLEITDENYDIALNLLKNRFHNKRLNFQAHIKGIFDLKGVDNGSVADLRELSDKLNAHLRALYTMGTKDQIGDCLLIHLICRKLDIRSQTKWEEDTPFDIIPTWESMEKFVVKRCQMLERVEYAMVSQTHSNQVGKNFHKPFKNINKSLVTTAYNTIKCAMCSSQEHTIHRCSKFLNLSPDERFAQAKTSKLCLNCLKFGHTLKSCKSGACYHCSLKHNSLLHRGTSSAAAQPSLSQFETQFSSSAAVSATAPSPFVAENAPSTSHSSLQSHSSPPTPPSQTVLLSHVTQSEHFSSSNQLDSHPSLPENFVFLATAVVFVKNKVGSLIPCRAVLDSASQAHFVTNRFANQLQLRRLKSSTIISGIGEADFVADETICIAMHSRVTDYVTQFTAVVVHTITDDQPSSTLNSIAWNIPANIRLADPLFYKSQRVDILIGAGLFFELMCIGQIRLNEHLPLLQKTRLGWVVCGGRQVSSKNSSCLISALKSTPSEESCELSLNELVSRFWDTENVIDVVPKATKEELLCERHFIENCRRLPSGEYSVRMPIKGSTNQLGDSFQTALHRFKNLEKRLMRRPDLKAQYSAFINEYSVLNHMTLVSALQYKVPTYFLPHHCVFKEESTSTKLRVVFDGSATTSSGSSLNDILMAGPTIQAKLCDILLRFRSFPIALTGDICKMYRCVRMSYPDNFLQCILWRDNPEDEIKIYKLDTVTYGTKSAAFLAIRSLHQLAIDEEHEFPIASKVVRRDFYVDDLISGGDSMEEVHCILKQTTEMLDKAGFQLRKWCSSESKILKQIPQTDRETLLKFNDGTEITKTLGLAWDPSTDKFLFSIAQFTLSKRVTKRSVLSLVARIYDPLGLIGPIITKAKIFIQHLWKENLDWDESLPQSFYSQWKDLCSEFQLVDNFSFPRFVMLPDSLLEIHAFCDASLSAYGVCIYICAKHGDATKTSLLCSKSKVAPLKVLTVPKLELSAAALLARLVHSISKLGIFKGDFNCWSDSTIVLSWLKEEPSNYNIFVSNRVSEIQTLTNGCKWHYVPTELNPADILSRGATPKELLNSSLWKHGPHFLETGHWPKSPVLTRELPERRKVVLISLTKPVDFSVDCKFINSFGKMQRIYAYVNKFCKRKQSSPAVSLTAKDLQEGTYLLLRMVQRTHMNAEYRALKSNETINSSSKIYCLRPFIDSAGIIRVGGRLQNSLLDFESKHPIILPKQHPITDSIINYYHNKFLHAGPRSLLASIRLQYWPIGGLKTVSRVTNKCIRCFRMKPKTYEHIMGNLPQERVQACRTFLVTGIDFCGPFYYQSEVRNRPAVKCYICLFICFATKAIHLELTKDLSTESFLAALKRFIFTRNKPKTIWSDNATNFVGAKNELAELKKLFENQNHIQAVKALCLKDSIDWEFIPPRSPHFGGLWEASIKIAKYHFWRVVGNSSMNFEELRTLVCQISAIVNSRPLFPITDNPDDLEVLTPAHFLSGAPFTSIVEPDVTSLNINRLSRWQRVCYLQQIFWKKWSAEYLTLLQERSKWRSLTPNVANGAMVLLKDENLPPFKWPLARVVETIKGDDGVARVAIVRTSFGTTRRAISKICVLPIDDDTVGKVPLPTGGGCLE